ncbi:MAG TPA: VWA domain-containing protein [Blastocatellia bacterium]|nr:VWA domain-containing protein [Blastocatellia bacterium]
MNKNKGKTHRAARASIRAALILSFLLLPFSLLAQSGRNPAGARPSPPPQQDTRPRRATAEEQDDKPIKLSADLVTAITSVTDGAGNQVNDLTMNDFVIYEDNVAQEIAGLYREGELPLRMVFLFDASSSIRHRLDFEKRAAAQFFRQLMRPSDQAALISVSTDPKVEVQFTSDVERLVAGLDQMKAEGATSLYNSLIEAAKYVRPAEGRHVMVVLSDGTDTASATTLAQALAEVQKSDAVIYSVHSTGVAPSANVQDLAGEFVLKAMSEDTGGRAFFPPIQEDPKKEIRDLDEIYRRIAAEVRAQYVLTYYSKSEGRPDTFRSIRVEVKRPGLQVRARRGYYTAKEK